MIDAKMAMDAGLLSRQIGVRLPQGLRNIRK